MDVHSKAIILIADSSHENLLFMQAVLEEHYQLRLAGSGADTIAQAQATPPELILLGVNLPDMDGFPAHPALCGGAGARVALS